MKLRKKRLDSFMIIGNMIFEVQLEYKWQRKSFGIT